MNHNLRAARRSIEAKNRLIEAKDRSIAELQAALSESARRETQLQRELSGLRVQYHSLEDTNRDLQQRTQDLLRIVEQRKSIINIQSKVIRLLDDTRSTIENSLKEQINDHEIEIQDIENQLKLVLTNKVLFDPGAAEISQAGKSVLLKIADSLRRNTKQHIVVEGHTDNLPIAPSLTPVFPTNWELSTARATAVVRFLQEEGHLDPARFSVCGYSHYRPVASNDTEEGRRQNRRIEIIVFPETINSIQPSPS